MAAKPVQGPGEGLLEEVSMHISCLQQVAGHAWVACLPAFVSHVQAPSYTLTTLSDLGCFLSPHKQCIYRLSLGLGLQTIHSSIHSTNIY